jgi:CRISPR/Cas system-associated exonuclease Cas4 (RecB family)
MEKLHYGPYSPSRLDAGVCGYQFKKIYIDKDPKAREENLPQGRGSAVHETFEKITAKMCEDPKASFSKEEIRNWVIESMHAHPISYEETQEILHMCELYIRKPPAILSSEAHIEEKLAIKLIGKNEDGSPKWDECSYDDPEAFARGRADILMFSDDTTEAVVYDHKTQMNIEEADTFQLGFYAWVISRYYPFLEKITTIIHFARFGMYNSYTWTKEELQAIEDEVMTRVGFIESRMSWEATPNSKCIYCSYIAECPAWRDKIQVDEETGKVVNVDRRSLQIMGNTQKAVEVAGLLSVLEQTVKVCKEELKDYVKDGGPIAIPGVVYEFRADEKIDWGKINKKMKKDVMEVFKKHNVDPTAFMGFSQTLSNHLWMYDKPELIKELSQLFPRKASTTFKGYKG